MERACSQAVRALSLQLDPESDGAVSLPFASVDIWRLLYAVAMEAAPVFADPAMQYVLMCVAHAIAATWQSGQNRCADAEEAAALEGMAVVARDGWQTKGADLYSAELLSRATGAWRNVLGNSPSAVEEKDHSRSRMMPCEALRVVGCSEAARQLERCATAALSTALLHDDPVRASWAVEHTSEDTSWLRELHAARLLLDYEWFDCEAEAGRVPAEHRAVFDLVSSRVCT